MKETTKNVNWNRDVKIKNGQVIINTKRTDVIFKGEDLDTRTLAIKQAHALSNFFSASGCHKVYKMGQDHYKILFDECIERDGVEDDCIYSASSHSYSGRYNWEQARTAPIYD